MLENVSVMSGKATYRIVVSRKVASVASEAIVSVRRAFCSPVVSVQRRETRVERLGDQPAVAVSDPAVLQGEATGARHDLE